MNWQAEPRLFVFMVFVMALLRLPHKERQTQ